MNQQVKKIIGSTIGIVFLYSFVSTVHAAEQLDESRVLQLVSTRPSEDLGYRVAALSAVEQKSFLDNVCNNLDYFKQYEYGTFYLFNGMLEKGVLLGEYEEMIKVGFNQLRRPIPAWVWRCPASKYFNIAWAARLVEVVKAQNSTIDSAIRQLVQEKEGSPLSEEEKKIINEQRGFLQGSSYAQLTSLLNKKGKRAAVKDEKRAVFQRRGSICLPMTDGCDDLSYGASAIAIADWGVRFEHAVAVGNDQEIRDLISEKSEGVLSPEERKTLQDKSPFLRIERQVEIATLLSLYPDTTALHVPSASSVPPEHPLPLLVQSGSGEEDILQEVLRENEVTDQ